MKRRRRLAFARLAPAFVGLTLLAGCGTIASINPFSSGSGSSSSAAASSCPSATILRPLAQTVTFAPGAEHAPAGVAFYGILNDVSAKCDTSGGAIHASLDVIIVGQRGASARGGTGVDLQYFVAVTGPNDTVLSKRSLPVHIAIGPNAKRGGVTDHIDEVIPLAGLPVGQLGIVLGFQLDPEVIDFFKHYRGV